MKPELSSCRPIVFPDAEKGSGLTGATFQGLMPEAKSDSDLYNIIQYNLALRKCHAGAFQELTMILVPTARKARQG